MKKIFLISIMVFIGVAMFGQNRTKIAKETIMEKLSEWSSPTNENYHKLKALGINADSLAYVKIEKISTEFFSSFEKLIDSQKDTVIVKHYSVLGKEKTDTVDAVVCTGMHIVYEFPINRKTLKTEFFISNHYIEFYVIFNNYDVIGIVMNIYKYFFEYYTTYTGYATFDCELVSTIREFDTQKVEIKTKKFCEIENERIVNKYIDIAVKNDAETKHRDNRVDDVY